MYCDTRLILQKLEQLFPQGRLGAVSPEHRALQKLLEIWTVEASVFVRAAQLIPSSMPLLEDPKFRADREDFNGRKWTKEAIDAMRPEALVHIKSAFAIMESTLLADGRAWLLNTERPCLADIEGERRDHKELPRLTRLRDLGI